MPHGFVLGLQRVVLVVVAFMRCMAVAVVKLVDMVSVFDAGVATVWAVLVFVPLRPLRGS